MDGNPGRRSILVVKNDPLSLFSSNAARVIRECSASLQGGADPRLLSAQLLLLCGKKGDAIAVLNELDRDRAAMEKYRDVVFKSGETLDAVFTVHGEPYRYFIALYNHTWLNERIVEIPVAARFLEQNRGNALEIGNVLGHYFSRTHAVVDKYETAEGVVNADIFDYAPRERYDAIVAISTLEHIGHDKVRDDRKVLRVYEHIVNDCLSERGAFLFTVPVGFNPVFDGYIDSGAIQPDECFCLKRVSVDNEWVDVGWNEIKGCKYMEPFHCANGLYVGIVYGKKHPKKAGIAVESKPSKPQAGGGPSRGRIESNAWLRQAAAGISGDVLSIGSRDDRDGEGGFYRNYFSSAKSYTTSDIGGAVDLCLDVRRMETIVDGRYACVFCSGVLEHVDDFRAGLEELTRILAKGGTLLLGLPFRQAIHDAPCDFWRFTKYAIDYMLKDRYKIFEIKEIDADESNFPVAYWVKAEKL
jgi:Methyltransferase domain